MRDYENVHLTADLNVSALFLSQRRNFSKSLRLFHTILSDLLTFIHTFFKK